MAPLLYQFPVDVAIKAFKFKRRLFYAPAFAEILCAACEQLPRDIDAVLPVPLHWRRKMVRGFNQSMELARPVAKLLGVPVVGNVFRVNATDVQSALSLKERQQNIRGAFAIRRSVAWAHVLIVDDVVTTGATANALARTLKKGGIPKVSLLVLARAR